MLDDVRMEQELSWEKQMVTRGIDRYMQNVDRAKSKLNKEGKRVSIKDESSTSYGVSMLKRFVGAMGEAVATRTRRALTGAGRSPIGYSYIASCDYLEVSYISAKCIIDSISRTENLTSLAARIGQRVEDQMRFATFSQHHPKYFRAVLADMKRKKVNDYRHKRKVLVHVANKAADMPENYQEKNREPSVRWIDWAPEHKLHIGVALIDCFIASTSDYSCDCDNNCYQPDHRIPGSGLVEKLLVKSKSDKGQNYIVGTDKAAIWIKENMQVAMTLQPDFMPTLIKPKRWTTPYNGGFHNPELRRRKPMVKTSREHLKMLSKTHMPEAYDALNTAQEVPWQVNSFVYTQALAEWQASHGIGMPGNAQIEPPVCPIERAEQGDMSNGAFKEYKRLIRESWSEKEKALFAEWAEKARECYTQEIERVSKVLGLSRVLNVARTLLDYEEFYYVHTYDYRGRMYPCGAGLTPQGPDLSKGLLKFSRGTALMDHGYWHMCIHAAGVYGQDTGDLEDRVRWVHDNRDLIMRTGLDPAETRDFWKSADKPYMFLAICEELSQVFMMYPETNNNCYHQSAYKGIAADYISHVPGAQDGKCNGIQHFSAMLLDPDGARYVNLSSDKEMQDIYQIAANRVVDMLHRTIKDGKPLPIFEGTFWQQDGSHYVRMAQNWLDFTFSRKGAKKSTMIIPYGGSKRSCLKAVSLYIKELIEETQKENIGYVHPFGDSSDGPMRGVRKAGVFMHHYLWQALDEVVVAARKAMKFLKDISSVHATNDNPIEWTTPTGFLARQSIMSTRDCTIRTILSGRIELTMRVETDEVDSLKMVQAFPPNVVHSMDGSHLGKTVNTSRRLGIKDFALVHDSFGFPFGHCETGHKVIRKEFVKIYKEDWLKKIYQEQIELYPELKNELPGLESVKRGAFNIEEVLKSLHFFR